MGVISLLLKDPLALPYLVQVKKWDLDAKRLPKDPALRFCYDVLNRVSRSFAIVIQQLPVELRDAVCIFYLVLRGLDTVEDDMSLAKEIKLPALKAFYKSIYKADFSMECGPATKGYYKELMLQFPMVVSAFLKLEKPYQDAIAEVTMKMGAGMAEFIEKEVVSLADYNRYCFYVAGLVGVGLSRLFAAGGLESSFYSDDADRGEKGLSNGMGLFLQKTNIIRDYLEDIMEEPAPRMFWPRVVWSKYAKELSDFKDKKNSAQAVQCLNHLVTDALSHATESLQYMSGLTDPQVFRFCAIPQVMAIATLGACYNNPDVFKTVVKIPRSMSARIMVTTRRMGDVLHYFRVHVRQLRAKVPAADPNAKAMQASLSALDAAIEKYAEAAGVRRRRSAMAVLLLWLLLLVALLWAAVAWGIKVLDTTPLGQHRVLAAVRSDPTHQAAATAALVLVSALLFG